MVFPFCPICLINRAVEVTNTTALAMWCVLLGSSNFQVSAGLADFDAHVQIPSRMRNLNPIFKFHDRTRSSSLAPPTALVSPRDKQIVMKCEQIFHE